MRRRRPTALYRVLDEEDLLFGTGYLDLPVAAGAGPADGEADAGDRPRTGREVAAGDASRSAREVAAGVADVDGSGSGEGRRWTQRGRALLACAGAMLLAVLVARLAGVLLAGSGSARGGRIPGGARVAAAPGAVSLPVVAGRDPESGRRQPPGSRAPAQRPATTRPRVPSALIGATTAPNRAAVQPTGRGSVAATGGVRDGASPADRRPASRLIASPTAGQAAVRPGPQEFGFER